MMKKLILFGFILTVLSLQAQELKIMTYNIKLDYPKEGEDSWTNRKPFFIDQLKFYEPDVLGVQEPMPNQMRDMDSLLVDYSFVGVGRDDGKNAGEFSAIFYKKSRVEVLESSTFWLSQTPDKVSMGWDAVCNRVCTYALFQDRQTKQKFWVFNTHFDHKGFEARKNSARLILQKIGQINSQGFPAILTGDFNMEPDNEAIHYIKEYLQDSKSIAQNTFGPEGTFNGFEFHKPVTTRIDYIFVSNGIKVKKYAVLSDNMNCHYPSDHFPVFITMKLKE